MRAALYLRKSTAQDDTNDLDSSIQQQRDACMKAITGQGWQLVETYNEGSGVSGGKDEVERPELARLIRDAKAKRFDVVVAWSESRISRDHLDYPGILRELVKRAKVSIYYAEKGRVVDQDIVNDPTKSTMEVMYGGQASAPRLAASADTKRGRLSRFENHPGWCSGRPPFGYTTERRDTGQLDKRGRPVTLSLLKIDPAQAAVVEKWIFTPASKGVSVRSITDRLNEQGLLGPGDRPFQPWAVRRMILNKAYCGVTRLNGATKHTEALRIISDDLFSRAQRTLKDHGARYAGVRGADGTLRGGAEGRITGKHLLAGLLVCGLCRSRLWLVPTRGRVYGRCKTFAAHGRTACTNAKGVPYAALTESILTEIASLNPSRVRDMYLDEMAKTQATLSDLTAQLTMAKRALAETDRKIERLVDAIEAGESVEDRLRVRRREQAEQKGALEALEARAASVDVAVDWEAWGQGVQQLVARLRRPTPAEMPAARQVVKRLFPSGIEVLPPLPDAFMPAWRWKADVAWEETGWRRIGHLGPHTDAWMTPAMADEEARIEAEMERDEQASRSAVPSPPLTHRSTALPSLGLRLTLEGSLAS